MLEVKAAVRNSCLILFGWVMLVGLSLWPSKGRYFCGVIIVIIRFSFGKFEKPFDSFALGTSRITQKNNENFPGYSGALRHLSFFGFKKDQKGFTTKRLRSFNL